MPTKAELATELAELKAANAALLAQAEASEKPRRKASKKKAKVYTSATTVKLDSGSRVEIQLDNKPMGAGPEAGHYSKKPRLRLAAVSNGTPAAKGGQRIPVEVVEWFLDNEEATRELVASQRHLTSVVGGKTDKSVKEFPAIGE